MNNFMVAFAAALVAAAGLSAQAAPVTWLTDLSQAQAQARAQHKLVVLDFSGSDWCPGCIELKKNVLDTDKFQAYAATNAVLVEVDFPDKKPQSKALKKANQALSEKYNIEAYPTLVILDANGKEVARQEGYGGEDAAIYISALEKVRAGK